MRGFFVLTKIEAHNLPLRSLHEAYMYGARLPSYARQPAREASTISRGQSIACCVSFSSGELFKVKD